MDPLMIEAMVHAHMQARTEHRVTRRTRRQRWVVAAPVPSRVFYAHKGQPR
jgi:hypothetical protein